MRRSARVSQRDSGRDRLVFDPGFGFAKEAKHSMALAASAFERSASSSVCRCLIGASRKSFLRLVDPAAGPRERLGASIAAAVVAWQRGAACVRVHDVRATKQALELVRASRPARSGSPAYSRATSTAPWCQATVRWLQAPTR